MRGRRRVDQPTIGCVGVSVLGVEVRRKIHGLSQSANASPEVEVVKPDCREKPLSVDFQVTVPQTDTGRWVEYTKANGRTLVKELGNIAP
jgi:hypothetical protein